jgi:glycerate dehydrogenase
LTENWNDELFSKLKSAGGSAYSNFAVGFNNIDIASATKHGISVGNTPGGPTDSIAEVGVGLTIAAVIFFVLYTYSLLLCFCAVADKELIDQARRIVEADDYMRNGKYLGWLPTLFVGQLLHGRTVGIVGAGRIGQSYARMMIEGHKMSCVYFCREVCWLCWFLSNTQTLTCGLPPSPRSRLPTTDSQNLSLKPSCVIIRRS